MPKRRYAERRAHAIDRARERYGAELTVRDLEKIESLIRQGDGITFVRESRIQSIHVIEYGAFVFCTVYRRDRGEVSTFLEMKVQRES